MEDRGWGRAYWTVLALAALLIPLGTAIAAWVVDSSTHMVRALRMCLPAISRTYDTLGARGIWGIGLASLVLILGVAPLRRRPVGVVLASLILACCMVFLMIGIAAGYLPFATINPGISCE